MFEKYSIGIDLGGTNLRIAAYRGGTEFEEVIQLPTRLELGPRRVAEDMCEAIEKLIGWAGGEPVGIGIGSPGPLELPSGTLRNPPNLPGWDGFNLRAAVEERLGRSVRMASDGNLAALAEQKLGAGRAYGVEDLCMFTLGTGVGGGVVLGGQVWSGATGMAGEMGHIVVEPEGAACGCGGTGCLEQYASATAAVRIAAETMGAEAPRSARDLAARASAGDPQAAEVFRRVGRALAIGLTAAINVLNLRVYVLGGGLCEAWSLFAPTLLADLARRSYVYRLTAPPNPQPEFLLPGKTYVLPAQLGSSAGLLGAALLAHP